MSPFLMLRLQRSFIIIVFFTCISTSAPIADGADKFLGNIANGNPPANFSEYWNQITLENDGKWGNVEKLRDQMDWSSISAAYTYAKGKKHPYKQHTFVWGTQEPTWIKNLSAAEQKAQVEEWIKAYGEKFPETEFIDVVNEPLNTPASFKNALGGSGSSGWDWVVWSFETARKFNPKAKLLINEFEIEYDAKLAANYLKIIMILKAKNLIDGIGIQCHTNEIQRDKPTIEAIKGALDTLASSELPLYISELDLKGDDATQLADYKRLFPLFWEHPAVRGVTLWGYVPPTWVSGTELMQNSNERPALKWLRTYVAEHKIIVSNQYFYKHEPQLVPFTICNAGRNIHFEMNASEAGFLRIIDPQGRVLPRCSRIRYNSENRFFNIAERNISNGAYIFQMSGQKFNNVNYSIFTK
jgi:endo-1,4-beta-xylanase